MRDRMKLPNIVVVVDREGVRTTPRIRMIESKLALLARTFSGDEPWRLVISPTGEIVDVVGFTGNELSVGDVVGPAVLEFMSQVDPRGDNLFVQLVMTVARSIADYGVPVGEIDLGRSPLRLRLPVQRCRRLHGQSRVFEPHVARRPQRTLPRRRQRVPAHHLPRGATARLQAQCGSHVLDRWHQVPSLVEGAGHCWPRHPGGHERIVRADRGHASRAESGWSGHRGTCRAPLPGGLPRVGPSEERSRSGNAGARSSRNTRR